MSIVFGSLFWKMCFTWAHPITQPDVYQRRWFIKRIWSMLARMPSDAMSSGWICHGKNVSPMYSNQTETTPAWKRRKEWLIVALCVTSKSKRTGRSSSWYALWRQFYSLLYPILASSSKLMQSETQCAILAVDQRVSINLFNRFILLTRKRSPNRQRSQHSVHVLPCRYCLFWPIIGLSPTPSG